jgi:TRAP transporter TAXI family solute receptor
MKLTKLALATGAMIAMAGMAHAEKMTVNLCTGSEGRPYNLTGQYIQGFLKDSKNVTLNVITTKGTWDNIERTVMTAATPEAVADGTACHAFIGQPDGAVVLKRKNAAAADKLRIIGQGPREFLHVLCSKDSGVDDLSDLAGRNDMSVALGPNGSGAWLIWQNFIAEDKSYEEVQVTNEEGPIAMSAVSSNTTTCALVPAAVVNATVLQADTDFGDSINLVGANDKDFNDAANIDGKALYRWQAIPSDSYPSNFQTGWFGNSIDTVAWQAGIYVNKDYFADNQKALEDLITAIAKSKPAIKNTFGSLE